MTREDVVLRKLGHLQRSCEYLRGVQGVSKVRFMKDRTVQLAVERAFQEAVEACLDIGRMLLADAAVGLPDTNRGVFVALGQHGLVPEERVEHWADMAGVRNVLVHGYDNVDLDIVYRALEERLEDLEFFARAILAHLERGAQPGRDGPKDVSGPPD